MNSRWTPRVTVAAVVARRDRFLCVEERTASGLALNQPAGHLEAGESLLAAVKRETLEETGWQFRPEAFIGVYRWLHPERDLTILRFAFAGVALECDRTAVMDEDIVATHWLTFAELQQHHHRMRSPLVLRAIEDYLAGRRFPLEVITDIVPEPN